jgi:type III restriction enzyme
MTGTFYEQPILNSPHEEPALHHALDEDGQPTDNPPIAGRRRSELITPVPKPRKRRNKPDLKQATLDWQSGDGISTDEQEYNPTPIINEIRSRVADWRRLPSQTDWGVTPATARLLQHWRHHDFQGIRPFFCQIEAVETAIWLTEVARKLKTHRHIWDHIQGANEQVFSRTPFSGSSLG